MSLLHGAPYVRVDVGGSQGLFLLDTGANTSGVDEGWLTGSGAEYAPGEETTIGGTTGNVTVRTARVARFELGGETFRDARFTIQSYAGFEQPAAGRQAGLLGTDFLNAFRLTLDYPAQWARLARRGSSGSPARGWASVPVDYPLNLPTARVRIGGVEMGCRIDTGACYIDERPLLDVNTAAADAVRAAGVDLEEVGSIGVIGVSGPETLAMLTADGLAVEFGPVRIDGVILVVHQTGTLAVPEPLALASANILTRLGRFTLDPAAGRMYVPGR